MVFSLEAVKAKEGDSLILHAGGALVVIDGGPPGVWRTFLRPRLERLKGSGGGPLRLEAIAISHIDSDHIAAMLDMLRELRRARDAGDAELVAPQDLWHNGLAELLGEDVEGAGL